MNADVVEPEAVEDIRFLDYAGISLSLGKYAAPWLTRLIQPRIATDHDSESVLAEIDNDLLLDIVLFCLSL